MSHPPRRLLLLRHGQSTWNADGRWQGQADPPLSALGEEQARQVAIRLANIGFVRLVSSDLRRALRTAEVLAAALNLPVEVDTGFRELDGGDWTGLIRSEIDVGWPGELARWSQDLSERPPGGESRTALVARTRSAIARVAGSVGPGQRVVVVAHGALMRNLDRALGLAPRSVANATGRWYDTDSLGWIRAGARFRVPELRTPAEKTD